MTLLLATLRPNGRLGWVRVRYTVSWVGLGLVTFSMDWAGFGDKKCPTPNSAAVLFRQSDLYWPASSLVFHITTVPVTNVIIDHTFTFHSTTCIHRSFPPHRRLPFPSRTASMD